MAAELFKSVANGGVEDRVADADDDAAEDVGIDLRGEVDLAAGLLGDLVADLADGGGVELHRGRHAHGQELVLLLPELVVSTPEKQDGLGRAVTDADDTVVNFLKLLIENHRMPVIFRVRREFDQLWQEENKLLPVQITSAVELDPATVSQIGDRIAEQTGRRVDLSANVDPDVLGGLVVRVGNSILDASIRNRLEQLRKQVARA